MLDLVEDGVPFNEKFYVDKVMDFYVSIGRQRDSKQRLEHIKYTYNYIKEQFRGINTSKSYLDF